MGSLPVAKAEDWFMDLMRALHDNPEFLCELDIGPLKVGEVISFEEVGILGRNRGFVVDLEDSEFQVTIVKSR